MNLFFSKRIFMAEADGGGNSAPAPAATTSTEAQPQAPAGLTKSDLLNFGRELRDGIFGDLRKAGVFGKQPKTTGTTTTNTTNATNAAAPPTATPTADLRSLDRALNRSGFASKLNDAQYKRIERDFATESPSDVEGWIADYFAGWGSAHTPQPTQPVTQAQTTTAPAPQKPINAQPVSDRGTPPPAVPLEEADIVTMSPTDRQALIKLKGMAWYRTKLASQLRGRPVSFR